MILLEKYVLGNCLAIKDNANFYYKEKIEDETNKILSNEFSSRVFNYYKWFIKNILFIYYLINKYNKIYLGKI